MGIRFDMKHIIPIMFISAATVAVIFSVTRPKSTSSTPVDKPQINVVSITPLEANQVPGRIVIFTGGILTANNLAKKTVTPLTNALRDTPNIVDITTQSGTTALAYVTSHENVDTVFLRRQPDGADIRLLSVESLATDISRSMIKDHPYFSPRGTYLAVNISGLNGCFRTVVYTVNTGVKVYDGECAAMRWRSDETQMLFTTQRMRLLVSHDGNPQHAATLNWNKLTGDTNPYQKSSVDDSLTVYRASWDPHGKIIALMAGQSDGMEALVIDLDTNIISSIVQFDGMGAVTMLSSGHGAVVLDAGGLHEINDQAKSLTTLTVPAETTYDNSDGIIASGPNEVWYRLQLGVVGNYKTRLVYVNWANKNYFIYEPTISTSIIAGVETGE